MTQVPMICIDGPSGSGKGTLCARLAGHLGWHLLDSGALYRLVALAASRSGVAATDHVGLADVARSLDVRFDLAAGQEEPSVLLAGEVVGDAIRTDEIGQLASHVAAVPEVREALIERQRAFRQAPGLVADGRDMGTVVFPEAPLKVYLTASAEERARRRHKQLMDKGLDASLRALLISIRDRDARDESRAVAPLRPADDAVVLDTTALDAEEVFAEVVSLLERASAQ